MELQGLLGVDLPIVQAPMAGVQGSALAIAVCNAGGLGSLPCALLDAVQVRTEIAAIRAASDKPFNVNFFCHQMPRRDAAREERWRAELAPYYREFGIADSDIVSGPARLPFGEAMADVVEDLKPPVVSFHFGLPPPPLLERVKATGSIVMSSATTVAEALWLEARGVDVVIAQGSEAGGHRGMFLTRELHTQPGTFALLPQVRAAVTIPVLAAGGIADQSGVAGAVALGAAGVQVGTAYLLCPETNTSPLHRRALQAEPVPDTVLTNRFTGRPARAIVNRLLRELGATADHMPDFPLPPAALAPLRAVAEQRGLDDFSSLWCGQNASGCRPVPAAEITRLLAGGL